MKLQLPQLRKKVPAPKRAPRVKLKASVARSSRSRIIEDDDEDYYDEPEPNMKLSHAIVVVLVLHVIAVAGVFAFNSIKSGQTPLLSEGAAKPSGGTERSVAPPRDVTQSPTTAVSPEAGRQLTAAPASNPAAQSAVQTVSQTSRPVASGAKTHEVQPGETLTRISGIYGVSVTELQEINEITDPTKIRVGEILEIPAGGMAAKPVEVARATATQSTPPAPAAQATTERVEVATPVAAAETPAPAAPMPAASTVKDSGEIYEVVKGDNPVAIARKLEVSYSDLMTLNQIEDPRLLQIGQKLKIPASN